MRRFAMAAVAGWPLLAFDPNGAAAPADYLEQERCLAVFNIALAVPAPDDPEETSPLMLKQMMLAEAYDGLERKIRARSPLTAEQMEMGAGAFEDEQRRWLEQYGMAATRKEQMGVVIKLVKEVDLCLPLLSK